MFAVAAIYVPFVDRLRDGRTAFLYNPYMFQDNPITLVGTTLVSGVAASLAFINSPRGSNAATLEEGNGNLGFEARALIGRGKIDFNFVKTDSAPWSKESYLAISDFPTFGPLSPLCYKVGDGSSCLCQEGSNDAKQN